MSHKPLFSNDFEQTGLVAQRSSTSERWDVGDVLINREVSAVEITAWLCRVFDLHPDEIFLIDEIEQVVERPASAKLVCQRSIRPGEDYPFLLSFWGIMDQRQPFATLIADLGKTLDCSCLVDDGSPDPYSMLQLDGKGKPRIITYYGS